MRTTDPPSPPDLAPHQQDAVRRLSEILRRRRGALLADEPGLGKTWVAATIARQRMELGERVTVVVPASLRTYWRDALSWFGVEASIDSHESLARGDVNRGEGERFVVVDEAHRFRNPLTKRYDGLARLSVNARLLLVTATPVCNSPADLLSLLKLIVADDELDEVVSVAECFSGAGKGLDSVLRQLVVRHSASEVKQVMTSRNDLMFEYEPVVNGVRLWDEIECLTFPWVAPQVHRRLVLLCLERRLESSVAARAATLRRMKRVCRRARHLADRGASLTATAIRDVFGDPDAPAFQDILFPELWGAAISERIDCRELDEESKRLERIEARLGFDSKQDLLDTIIRKRHDTPGLVFTVSYDTAWSLFVRFRRELRCALLTGRRCEVNGRRAGVDAVASALASGDVDLVIATDLGAEGLNLQSAGYVVHYDQPWNPSVIEQRNGRICRIGQRRDSVDAIHLIAFDSHTHRIVRVKQARNARVWDQDAKTSHRGYAFREWKAPSVLVPSCGQVRLVRRLRAGNSSSAELAELLSTHHRVGVERLIERLVREPLDQDAVEGLLNILQIERAMISRHVQDDIIRDSLRAIGKSAR